MNSELSSNEVFELDDVLDSSLMDSEPSTQGMDTDVPDYGYQSSPIKGGMNNLSRWDRIPMATFRRTRETATASGVDAGAASDSGISAYRSMGALMLSPPPLDKMSRASARKRKGRQSHPHSPLLLPSSQHGSPSAIPLGPPFAPQEQQQYQQKSKKEVKKEKAMMKRRMGTKSSQLRSQQPHRSQHYHHNHHPNHKSRGTGSVQRTGSFFAGSSSSVLPLNP